MGARLTVHVDTGDDVGDDERVRWTIEADGDNPLVPMLITVGMFRLATLRRKWNNRKPIGWLGHSKGLTRPSIFDDDDDNDNVLSG